MNVETNVASSTGAGPAGTTVSVVLPCLNEADSVGACVAEALAAMADAGIDGEVLVVDNGSTDGSAALAVAAGARVIDESARGYGSAHRAGFAAATGDVVVMADADRTYELSAIPALVAPVVADQADLVCGARLSDATNESMPFLHRFVGTPILTLLVTIACGRRVSSDSQSGFRAFDRRKMATLGLTSTGMELASEMFIRAARQGWRITEIDTTYRVRVGDSKLDTWRDGWRHLRAILRFIPHIVLLVPGVAFLALAAVLSVLGLAGVAEDSPQWAPGTWAGPFLTLGGIAVTTGVALGHRATKQLGALRPSFATLLHPRILLLCGIAAAALATLGLLLRLVVGPDLDQAGPAATAESIGVSLFIIGIMVVGRTIAGACMDDQPPNHRPPGASAS